MPPISTARRADFIRFLGQIDSSVQKPVGAPANVLYDITDSKQEVDLAQLLVRNLEDDVKVRLRVMAAEHGHSMEEEVRAILRRSVAPPGQPLGGLGTEIAALFKGNGLRDGEEMPEMRGQPIKPWHFDDC